MMDIIENINFKVCEQVLRIHKKKRVGEYNMLKSRRITSTKSIVLPKS